MARKSELRNYLEERFKNDEEVFLPKLAYRHLHPDVSIVDALTRMHSLKMPTPQTPGYIEKRSSEDGGFLMTLVGQHLDYFYARGSACVVWIIDKPQHVPVTKGVEQMRRVTPTDRRFAALDSDDPDEVARAHREIARECRVLPGMTDAERRAVVSMKNKLLQHMTQRDEYNATRARLTILELDDMRRCWRRLPRCERERLLRKAMELGLKLRWYVEGPDGIEVRETLPEGSDMDDAIVDDYQLQAMLMATIREQNLPQPWDALIKSGVHMRGARGAIIRYIVKSLLHGFYDAYAPPRGRKLYIDGHGLPSWHVPRPAVRREVTPLIKGDDKLVRVNETTFKTDGTTATRCFVYKDIETYSNKSPLELSHPEDSGTKEGGEHDVGPVYQMQSPLANLMTFLENSSRGSIPNVLQPRWRYAKELGNTLGEGDFAAFHWIDKLAYGPRDGGGRALECFEVVSIDTDLLYLALLYLHKLRCVRKETHVPRIVLVMDSGWFPHKKHIIDANVLYERIVDEMLDGDEQRIPSFIFGFYASGSDYTMGYKHVTPKTFIKSILEYSHDIGPLVQDMGDDGGAEASVWNLRLNAHAYRRLIQAAYTVANESRLIPRNIVDMNDVRSLSHLRAVLNGFVIKSEYRRYFEDNDTHRSVATLPSLNDDVLTKTPSDANELEVMRARRKIVQLRERIVTNVQKKIPSDDEIAKRGLLLQYFIHMCSQVGQSSMQLLDPCLYGFAPRDPNCPLSRNNIRFAASYTFDCDRVLDAELELELS